MTFAPLPYYAFDHPHLLAVAQRVLEDRLSVYPSRVFEGKMDEATAAAGIRVMRAIVADRQRVVDLRADREAAPVDATATDFEKRQATGYVHQRAIVKLQKAHAACRAVLDAAALREFDQPDMSCELIRRAYDRRAGCWGKVEVREYLEAEDYAWGTQALHWHTERWPMDVLNAEMRLEQLAINAAREPARRAA